MALGNGCDFFSHVRKWYNFVEHGLRILISVVLGSGKRCLLDLVFDVFGTFRLLIMNDDCFCENLYRIPENRAIDLGGNYM
mgnify:CR=1 FL=1